MDVMYHTIWEAFEEYAANSKAVGVCELFKKTGRIILLLHFMLFKVAE